MLYSYQEGHRVYWSFQCTAPTIWACRSIIYFVNQLRIPPEIPGPFSEGQPPVPWRGTQVSTDATPVHLRLSTDQHQHRHRRQHTDRLLLAASLFTCACAHARARRVDASVPISYI
jgi:hypothetical protein